MLSLRQCSAVSINENFRAGGNAGAEYLSSMFFTSAQFCPVPVYR